MNNVFECAKFGDKFLTKDGRVAIIVFVDAESIWLHIEGTLYPLEYDFNGISNIKDSQLKDIISRYQESIDEDKLDELAKKFYPITNEYIDYQYGTEDSNNQLRKAFKVGYRKAKEE